MVEVSLDQALREELAKAGQSVDETNLTIIDVVADNRPNPEETFFANLRC